MAGDPGFAAEFWPFEFATAAKIRFGSGVLSEIGAEAARWGRAALVVTGSAARIQIA